MTAALVRFSSAMVPFYESFQNWKDFPRGLSVLVVDEDKEVLNEIKFKLERYRYIVTSFSNGDEALEALVSQASLFHVALVEAGVDGYRFLQFSKDLPTINLLQIACADAVISAIENMPMMVKSIALGAVEFLLKPLSEDKLKNIWQHVVRKAVDSRDNLASGFLEPGKPSVGPAGQDLQAFYSNEIRALETANLGSEREECNIGPAVEMKPCPLILSVVNERFPAPSTPQLEQGGRIASEEATLDESPRSHDSTQDHSGKQRITDRSSISDNSVTVKSESKEVLHTRLGPSAAEVTEEETDHHPLETRELLCHVDSKAEPVAYNNVDTNTIQISNSKSLESMPNAKSQKLAVESLELSKPKVAVVPTAGDGSFHLSDKGHDNERGEKEFLLHFDDPKDPAECTNAESSVPQSCDHGQIGEEGREDIKRKLNGPEQAGKENKTNGKKKFKVDWTADLHRSFVQAVEFLGVDQAIPSKILEVMKVDGLTRHNIASHLQKYRSHRKHLLAREVKLHQNRLADLRPWSRVGQDGNQQLASYQSNSGWIQPWLPTLPFQTHPSVQGQRICPPLHVWGYPMVEPRPMHVLQQHSLVKPNPLQTPDGLVQQYPVADACGGLTSPGTLWYGQHMKFFLASSGCSQGETPKDTESCCQKVADGIGSRKLRDINPPKELLDAAINEVLSNPWTPLPLGLKPPAMESVMIELQRQGVNTGSPHTR